MDRLEYGDSSRDGMDVGMNTNMEKSAPWTRKDSTMPSLATPHHATPSQAKRQEQRQRRRDVHEEREGTAW